MLDQATAVFVTDNGRNASPVLGVLPPEAERQSLSDMLQERPAARKHGAGMAVSVPLPQGRWCLWLLPGVPKLTDLAPMLTRAQTLCGALVGLGQAGGGTDLVAMLGTRLAAPCKNTGDFVAVLGEALVEAGEVSGIAVFTLRGGRVRSLWTSDNRVATSADLLRNLIPTRTGRLLKGGDDIEAQMILEKLGAGSMQILTPARDGDYGAVLIDAADPPGRAASEVPAIMQIARPLRRREKTPPLVRGVGIAAGLLAAAFLLWPVPAKITVSGMALPAQSTVAALTTDATLQTMHVRVGDVVKKGQPVATFTSRQLSEELAQEQLNIAVEELNVQAAMAKNDYGAARLAGQRREIAQTRRQQVQNRIADLSVTAPADGRVISALAQNASGAGFQTGREIIAVQTSDDFLMALTPSRVDARRIHAGMTGEARFRGLTGGSFQVEILTPPALVHDTGSGAERMEVIARLGGASSETLMAGLTGYARIEGERTLRILDLTHYLIEYMRTVTWTYLGLRL